MQIEHRPAASLLLVCLGAWGCTTTSGTDPAPDLGELGLRAVARFIPYVSNIHAKAWIRK